MANKELVCDSWEALEESEELDKQLQKIKINSVTNELSNKSNPNASIIILSEDLRAKLLPPEPAVKILQRPNQNGCKLINGETKMKQPLKTLQQREMEYAEARLRILGQARNPEEDQTPPLSPLEDRLNKGKSELPKPVENYAGVLRLPKGPDGTSGFNMQR